MLKNASYAKMLNKTQQIHFEQTKDQIDMHTQRENIVNTVDEIKHVHQIDN